MFLSAIPPILFVLLQESRRTPTPLPHYNSDTSAWSDHKTASIDSYSDTTSEPSYTYHEHQHSLHSMLTINGPLHSTLNYPLHSTLLDAPAHTCTAHHVTATGTARCQTTHNSTYTVLPGRPDDKQDEVNRKLELKCRMKRFQKQLMKRGLGSFKVLTVL